MVHSVILVLDGTDLDGPRIDRVPYPETVIEPELVQSMERT